MFFLLSEKRIPGGTPLGKVIGRGGMESNVAAATVPPVATATGVASLIASKTSATVSAKGSASRTSATGSAKGSQTVREQQAFFVKINHRFFISFLNKRILPLF